ncbi:hypothetical protein DFH08DRAFT_1039693 [Mycena albidolilacea]|uniref:Uncharacterized protein n=1 Tax=Mycena albidolilacea TaxID=1033008 RepID=A0AAD6ZCX5_9AGAR|nr:hypothetical protein DFH08DRAFT_1039693 [Mycena albidolilacea]
MEAEVQAALIQTAFPPAVPNTTSKRPAPPALSQSTAVTRGCPAGQDDCNELLHTAVHTHSGHLRHANTISAIFVPVTGSQRISTAPVHNMDGLANTPGKEQVQDPMRQQIPQWLLCDQLRVRGTWGKVLLGFPWTGGASQGVGEHAGFRGAIM